MTVVGHRTLPLLRFGGLTSHFKARSSPEIALVTGSCDCSTKPKLASNRCKKRTLFYFSQRFLQLVSQRFRPVQGMSHSAMLRASCLNGVVRQVARNIAQCDSANRVRQSLPRICQFYHGVSILVIGFKIPRG